MGMRERIGRHRSVCDEEAQALLAEKEVYFVSLFKSNNLLENSLNFCKQRTFVKGVNKTPPISLKSLLRIWGRFYAGFIWH